MPADPLTISPKERTKELEQKMLEKLELVGILYLVERWSGTVPHSWGGQELSARATRKGSANLSDLTATPWHSGLDHVARWEDVLSLGEQQRLSLARMFW